MANADISLTPEQLQAIQAAVAQLQQALTDLPSLTPKDRLRLTKSSNRSTGYITYLANLVREQPDLFPASFPREQFLAMAELWEPLLILQATLHQQMERVDSLKLQLGSQLVGLGQEAYQVIRASSRSHPDLAEHVKNLSQLYRKRGSGSAAVQAGGKG